MNQYPAAGLASLVAAQGQGPDTTLVHMTQDEVRALQDMARAQGYELPLNPVTGLPQAGFLSDFLSTIGRGISTVARTAIQNPQTTALLTGAAYGAIKGDLQKGLEAGMKAYAGTQILGGLTSLGRGTVPAPTETKPGAPRSEAEQKPAETGGAPTPSKPAVGTVRTTVQQPGGLDAVLRSILGGGQPGTTQQGQQGVFGAARDPIMEFIKLYAINKAGQKMGQDKYMPKPEPVQYRDVDFSYGQVNPRFGEPGQPYFIGGGYTDRGITTQYPGLKPPATTPQQGQAPPGQPPPNIPVPARTEPIEFYRPPQTQPGYSMAGGGIVPRPNPNFPMSRVQDNGYEVPIDAYTGEEKFADGGVADTEEERRRKYFENLRPFAPALTDLYRGTPSTGGESAQGDTYLRETDPLTGLTTGAPKVVGTGIDSLRPYDPNLADWYKSLLNPPVGREPVDMGDYYKTTPFRAQTQYGDVTPYPIPTGPTPPPPPPPPPSQTRTCPPGTKNAGKEYNPLDFLTGGDPCGGLVGQCGANEFRNPASGECECNAGFERGPDGVCKGKGTGNGEECKDPNAAKNTAGECVCKEGYELGADGACKGTGGGGKCDDPNAEKDATGACVCKSGYTLGADGKCGKGGGGGEPCADSNAERDATGACVCKSGYTLGADGKCGKGGGGGEPCADSNAERDATGACVCKSGYTLGADGKCGKGGGGGGKITPADCLKIGLIFSPEKAELGMYPCIEPPTKECPPNSSRLPTDPEGPCRCDDNTTNPGGVAPEDGCKIKEEPVKECNPKTEYKDKNGECLPRCLDGSIPSDDGYGCKPVGPGFCDSFPGTTYDPSVDIGLPGINPCIKLYKCPNSGKLVLDPVKCDEGEPDDECEWVGSTRDKDGVCRCNDGRIPDPERGCDAPCEGNLPRNPETNECPPRNRIPPLPGGGCPKGYEADPTFSKFGLTICKPAEDGDGGNTGGNNGGGGKKSKCKPHEVEFQGQCLQVCNEGETYDPDKAAAGLNPCSGPGGKTSCGEGERYDPTLEGLPGVNPCVPDDGCGAGQERSPVDNQCYKRGEGPKTERTPCGDGTYADEYPNGECFGTNPPEGGTPSPYSLYWKLVGGKYLPFYGWPSGPDPETEEWQKKAKTYRQASGGYIKEQDMKKKRAKKYQTGGIASLNRTRMGAAVNPADGYNFGFAKGGLPSLPEYRAGGKLLRGPGDGMSDDIPAVIRGKGVQRAALADGEFVIPADVVSHLGNGSTEAGAKKLYKMMAQIRAARTGKKKQAPQVNADKYLPRV